MKKHEIKNLIFDLGGVILNIDFSLSVKAFEELNRQKAAEIRQQTFKSPFFHEFEKGKLSTAEFKQALCNEFHLEVEDKSLEKAWNALILDFPKENIALLEKLKHQYRTFLLSNINTLHLQRVEERLYEDVGLQSLDGLFEKTYYSHLVGKRKPDSEIFIQILEENNLLPEESIFVDDVWENVYAARQLGLHGIHLEKEKARLIDLFISDLSGKYLINL